MTLTPTTKHSIDAALEQRDYAEAARLAETALANGQSDVVLYRLIAWQREEREDFAGAHAALARALELAPGDPAIITEIGAVWCRSGQPAQGLEIFDAMIAKGLDFAPTWLERGHALKAMNRHEAAHESYRRTIALDPQSAAALSGAADTALRLGHAKTAGELAHQALEIDPADLVAHNALALIDNQATRFKDARARLQPIVDALRGNEPGIVETLTLLGDAHGGLGEYDPAFACYTRAQSLYRSLLEPRFGDERRSHRALMAHILEQLPRLDPDSWRPLPSAMAGGGTRGHVFLMGYPRSGTTLVENVLASLPDVVALEEKPLLAATEGPVFGSEDGVARLGELDLATADRFRSAYWQSVAMHGAQVARRFFVDMNPLRGISLPIIARLFPDARVVVMRRDPRDVVWSCLRHHFAPSPTGYALSDLRSSALHYDALMTLTQACLERLPVHAHILKYDDLVGDFDESTKALCRFIGLDWSTEVRSFDQTAARRGVATASMFQVRKGLFNGTGQWRPYAEHLAPVMDVLEPWVERFGFAA